MDNKTIVELITALTEVASQGRYTVDPAGARHMNAVFDAAAATINVLEAEDAPVAEVAEVAEGEEDDS